MKWNWLPAQDATTRDILKVVRPDIADSPVYSLDQAGVLYLFRGSLAASGRIQIQGVSPDLFQPDHLYARTAKLLWKIVAIAWLKPTLFEQSHDSAFINMRQLPVLIKDSLELRWYQFTFPDQHVEQVPISRRCYAQARRSYRRPSPDLPPEPLFDSNRIRPLIPQDAGVGSHDVSRHQSIARQKTSEFPADSPGHAGLVDTDDSGVHDARRMKTRIPTQVKAGSS
jgi:hypothetical protein